MTDLRKLSTGELIAAYGIAEWPFRKPIALELKQRGVEAGLLFSRVRELLAATPDQRTGTGSEHRDLKRR